MESKTCVIDLIQLTPYSTNYLLFVSGYSCDEVLDYVRENIQLELGSVTKIRKSGLKKREWLDFVEAFRESFDKLKKGSENYTQGSYISDTKLDQHMILMKEGFDIKNPENMISLAHEVLHLCQAFLPTYLDRDEEHEAEAYLHSHIMRTIVNFFK